MADTDGIDIYELEEELAPPEWPGDKVSRAVAQVVRAEARQTRNLIRRIMSDLQQHLDTDISALADVIDGLEAEISSLKAAATNAVAVPAAELDFTNADALVAQAKDALASLAGPSAAAAAAADPSAAGAASGDTAAPAQPSGTAAASADAAAGSSAVSGPAESAPLTVTTTLPPAWVGQAYTAGITPEGGTGPFTWSFSGLPDGLSGAPDGTITGTPTAVGDASVSLSVTDSTGAMATGTATLSVTA